MKEFFQTILALGVIGFVFWILISAVNEHNMGLEREKQRCTTFGQQYEWRDGDRAPNICVNTETGEIKYP